MAELVQIADITGPGFSPEVLADLITEADGANAVSLALDSEYADRDIQSLVDTGRLNEGSLASRYDHSRFWMPADMFEADSVAPNAEKVRLANYRVGWRLNWTTDEAVVGPSFMPHPSWSKFEIIAHGVNQAAGSGDVRARVYILGGKGPGDVVTTGPTVGATATITAPAQNVDHRQRIRWDIESDPTKTYTFRYYRVASDAADTLTNDWVFLGLEIRATEFRPYEPTEPLDPTDAASSIAMVPPPHTFVFADNARLRTGLRVFEQSPPPTSDNMANYRYWPGKDFASQQVYSFPASTTTQDLWAWIWVHRYEWAGQVNDKPSLIWPAQSGVYGPWTNKKGDPTQVTHYNGLECRLLYTTLAKADAATQALSRYHLGYAMPDVEAPWIAAGGVAGDFISEANARNNPAAYFTGTKQSTVLDKALYAVATNKIILPDVKLSSTPQAEGLLIDFEPADGRTPAQTTAFLLSLIADCHAVGKKAYIYTNPLDSPIMQHHGLDTTNIPTILAASDYFGLMLWGRNAQGSVPLSWAAQVAKLGTLTSALWAKVVMGFELREKSINGTSISDAEWAGAVVNAAGVNRPGAVNLWKNYAIQGGAPTREVNEKIAALLNL